MISLFAFVGFIIISILSYVFSAKYNRSPTPKVNSVLRKFRFVSLIGVIFSSLLLLAAIFIGVSGVMMSSISEENIVMAIISIFLFVLGILSVIPLIMSSIALAKLNNALAAEPAIQRRYCSNCHAQCAADGSFCTKCGSQSFYVIK